jgi:hypothetical protein
MGGVNKRANPEFTWFLHNPWVERISFSPCLLGYCEIPSLLCRRKAVKRNP